MSYLREKVNGMSPTDRLVMVIIDEIHVKPDISYKV
jgi:hypothetical protein